MVIYQFAHLLKKNYNEQVVIKSDFNFEIPQVLCFNGQLERCLSTENNVEVCTIRNTETYLIFVIHFTLQTPCYKKTVLGSKQTVSGIIFFLSWTWHDMQCAPIEKKYFLKSSEI